MRESETTEFQSSEIVKYLWSQILTKAFMYGQSKDLSNDGDIEIQYLHYIQTESVQVILSLILITSLPFYFQGRITKVLNMKPPEVRELCIDGKYSNFTQINFNHDVD